MSELLEKSLDDIITKKVKRRGGPGNARSRPRNPRSDGDRGAPRGRRDTYRPPRERPLRSRTTSQGIPEDIAAMAGDRALLRVKNIHSELNGRDLSELFGTISPVEFVKFDPQRETVAYVLFENDQKKNNNLAVEKFDGRQAMRRTLVVENTTLLADRIVASERPAPIVYDQQLVVGIPERYQDETAASRTRAGNNRGKRGGDRAAKKAAAKLKTRAKPTTVDDLDEQLNAYMNNRAQETDPSAKDHVHAIGSTTNGSDQNIPEQQLIPQEQPQLQQDDMAVD